MTPVARSFRVGTRASVLGVTGMRRLWPGLLLGLMLVPGVTIGLDPLLHQLGLPAPTNGDAPANHALELQAVDVAGYLILCLLVGRR